MWLKSAMAIKLNLPWLVVIALAALTTGCAGGEETAAPATPTPGQPAAATPTPGPVMPTPTPPALPQPVNLARDQLAARLNVAPAAIEVREYQRMEWPDACLGLPQQGMLCAQVITPGYRVVLSAQGATYVYRTNLGSTVLPE